MSDEPHRKPGPPEDALSPMVADHAAPEVPIPDLTEDAQTSDPLADVPPDVRDKVKAEEPKPWGGTPFSTGSGSGGPGSSDAGPVDPVLPDLTGDPLIADPVAPRAEEEPSALEESLAAATERSTTPDPAPHAMPITPMAPKRQRSGFWGLVTGGIIAAALGGGVAWYVLTQMVPSPPLLAPTTDSTLNTRLNDQAGEISLLKSEIARLSSAPPPAAPAPAVPDEVTNEIAALREALSSADTRAADLSQRLDALSAQVSSNTAATEGLPADTSQLEDQIRAQGARFDDLAARFADLQSTTKSSLDDAAARSQAASMDAVMARLGVAVAEGLDYAPLLGQAEGLGVSVPEALRAQSAGIATEDALKERFPAAARAALDAANLANAEGAGFGDRATVFLRNQLGVRSLAPREGTSADAILSRMQAEVSAGRFDAALKEAQALPPEGRAAMQDWFDAATARATTVQAVADLQAQMNR